MFPVDRMTIEPRTSWALAGVLVTAHVVAAGVPWLLRSPTVVGVAVGLLLAAHLILAAGDQALRRMPWSARRLTVVSDGQAIIERRDRRVVQGRVVGDTWVSRYWTVVNLGLDGGGRRAVVLGPGALPPHEQRRLRVFLTWGLQGRGEAQPTGAGRP
jgi:hypothetical protein